MTLSTPQTLSQVNSCIFDSALLEYHKLVGEVMHYCS